MQKVNHAPILNAYNKVQFQNLKLLSPLEKLKGLFTNLPHSPENHKQKIYNANDILIAVKHDNKKKKSSKINQGAQELAEKREKEIKDREKVYKAGPFALFYEINEQKFDKDEEVWYYKENKDIFGPVSSYNMDIMVYYKRIDDDTRVAFKTVDKFVKFGKIKKIVQGGKNQ